MDARGANDLAQHIADRYGNDGIQEIDEFQQCYADNFGGDDLSRLLPPRMVLVGMVVDPVAARMAKLISERQVDLFVMTFDIILLLIYFNSPKWSGRYLD